MKTFLVILLMGVVAVASADFTTTGVFDENAIDQSTATAGHQNNDIDSYASGLTAADLQNFKNAIAAGFAADKAGVVDFDLSTDPANSFTGGDIVAKYGVSQNKSLVIDIIGVGSNHLKPPHVSEVATVQLSPISGGPQETDQAACWQPGTGSDGLPAFTWDIGAITGGDPDESVSTVGFVLVSRTTYGVSGEDISITANYSDGTSESLSVNIAASLATDDTFVMFTAPAGSAIDSLDFEVTATGATNYNLSRPVIDDFAFITGGLPSAHTPAPTGDVVDPAVLDPAKPGFVTWQAPLTRDDVDGDPNLVSVDGYDITYYIVNEMSDDDPNWVIPGKIYDGQTDLTDTYYAIDLDDAADEDGAIYYEQTMFWRVDTHVTWDSNDFTGTDSLEAVIPGASWQFSTIPQYVAPEITFDSAITTFDLIPTTVSATVENNTDPITSATFTLLTDDVDFPVGSDAYMTVTDVVDLGDGFDLSLSTALVTTVEGTYKIKLVVSDGLGDDQQAIAEVVVYADDCEATKAAGLFDPHEFDLNEDCYVDLLDFAEIAAAWLDDTTMDSSEAYSGVVDYVPQAVYDLRIEAEWVDPNDPNACSDGPISDNVGIRIQDQPNASGGQATGYSSATAWIEYTVDVPISSVGVAVDVYAGHALNGTGTVTLSFGTEATPDAYGVGTLDGTSGWTNFTSGRKIGEVTFTTAGPQIVRTSYGGGLNLDWFAFDF